MRESLAVKITEEHIRASINKICCSDECPVRLWSSPNVIEDVKTNRIHHLSISQGNDRTNNLLSLMRSTGMRQDTKLFHNFHGTRVCKTKWSQLLGISMHTYYRGMILIKKGFVQIEQVNGIEKRSIKGMDDIGFIIHAIHMYGDQSPERDRIELPACISKKSIYEEYLELPIEHVMDKHFYRLFQEYFGDKVSFGKFHNINPCDICIKGKEDLSKTTDPEMKIALKKTLKEHLDRQRQERLSYYDRRGNAITRPDKFMSVIIDGMDQAKTNLPHFRGWSRPKAAYPVLKTHITGVILHGLQTKFYLDILQWPHDPNLTMTCLLKSIRDHLKDGCLPETLYIQCDNCGRENKNRYILGFLAVLCRLGYVKEVILSFLMKGHTHEDIDQRFSKISSRLLKNNAKTILQLQDEIRKTFLNESKVEILGTCWDVKSWLNGSVSDVHNHSYPHQFWFYADTPGHVAMKTRLWSTEEWMPNDEQAPLEILRMDDNGNQLCPSGNPPRIAPSYEKCNFNVQRSLIEKMKIHLSEEEYNWWQNFFEKPDSISGGEDIWCLQDIRRIHRMETIPLAINNIETSLTPLMENERSCREVYTGRLQRNYNRKQ